MLFNLVGWTYLHMRTGHGWSPARATEAVLYPVLYGLYSTASGPDWSQLGRALCGSHAISDGQKLRYLVDDDRDYNRE